MSCIEAEGLANQTQLYEFLDNVGISYKENVDLSTSCHMKAGGICNLYITPRDFAELEALIQTLLRLGVPYILVGKLSNTLFRSGLIKTVVIATSKMNSFEFTDDGFLHADSGVSLPKLAKQLTEKGYTGYGGLSGFPASVGGAIYMNASCYGNAISDYLTSVICLNAAGEKVIISNKEAGFAWRYSKFHDLYKGYVITGATFKPEKGDASEGKLHLISTRKNRIDFQERKYPNLGSTFATVDIYGDIAKCHKVYKFFYIALKISTKAFGKKRDKVWALLINKFTQFYFGLKEKNGIGFSGKTMNCVVNKDRADADDIIDFIYEVKHKIGNAVDIEIDIYDKIY